MGVRTIFYKVLVLLPVAFLAYLGIVGRFQKDTFQIASCNVHQTVAIDSYRYPVSLVLALPNQPARLQDEDAMEFVSAMWLHEARIGKLRPITPAVAGASIREGVAGQIRIALNRVVEMQIELARRKQKAGDILGTLEALEKSHDLVAVLKYSDETSVALGAVQQRSILNQIRQLALNADKKLYPHFEEAAKRMLEKVQPLDPVISHSYALAREYKFSRQNNPVIIDEPGTIVAFAASIDENEGVEEGYEKLVNSSEFQMAIHAEREFYKALKNFRYSIGVKKAASMEEQVNSPMEPRKISGKQK